MKKTAFVIHQDQIQAVKTYLLSLQKQIYSILEDEEQGKTLTHDHWNKDKSNLQGEGLSCILENGEVIEKAAINFSHVFGESLPASATALRAELANTPFEALGISLIIHPRNPYVPTTHANLRLFTAKSANGASTWWFGGGFDLTPYYGFMEDCQHFHKMAKAACDPFGSDVYANYKKWADDYFYIKHRDEHRGIGGIFFDDLNIWGFERCFEFIKSVGEHFILAYQPILNRRKQLPYGERERNFQLYRRGRYVEFNLIYDRGTLFGLKSGGRIESILASLPPLVSWLYHFQPEPETPEAQLKEQFLKPRDWVK